MKPNDIILIFISILSVILLLLSFISSYLYYNTTEIFEFYKTFVYVKLTLSCIIVLCLLIQIIYIINTKQKVSVLFIFILMVLSIFGIINIILNSLIINKLRNSDFKYEKKSFNTLEIVKFSVNIGLIIGFSFNLPRY
jgi:hypothetical protein